MGNNVYVGKKEVVVVRQALDTEVSVTINRAFAVVAMEFETQGGGRAHVELDMESTINVMEAMDNGRGAMPTANVDQHTRNCIIHAVVGFTTGVFITAGIIYSLG